MQAEMVNDCKKTDLRKRTKVFALTVISIYSSLPKTDITNTLGKQFLRSGTSVGAHYREANRARSTAEFISKMEVGLQELDETSYWIELFIESEIVDPTMFTMIQKELDELISIFVTSVKTAKSNKITSGER